MSGSYNRCTKVHAVLVPADAHPAVMGLLTIELARDRSVAVGILHPALPGLSAPFVQFGGIDTIEPHGNASTTCCDLDSVCIADVNKLTAEGCCQGVRRSAKHADCCD